MQSYADEINQKLRPLYKELYGSPEMAVITKRVATEKSFRNRLYSDPSSVAKEYKIKINIIQNFIDDHPKEKFPADRRKPRSAKLI